MAALKSAANVQHATMVTAMGGNGVEFGIKLSGRGEQWFTAPSPTFTGRYFSPEYSDRDSSPWLGDSSNVEAFGLGGMAAGAAPILIRSRGGDVASGADRRDGEDLPRRESAIPDPDAGWTPRSLRNRRAQSA